MATINVSEADFIAIASAAQDAQDAGDNDAATALDKIARKINAALAGADPVRRALANASGMKLQPVRWQDMPSVLKQPT